MAYHPNPDDNRLEVEFYAEDGVDFVRIKSTEESLERVFRALDVSHIGEDDEEVTYAARFAPQYAAFQSGATKSANDKIEKLEAQIADAKAEKAGVNADSKKADAVADKAAADREAKLKAAAKADEKATGTVKVLKA